MRKRNLGFVISFVIGLLWITPAAYAECVQIPTNPDIWVCPEDDLNGVDAGGDGTDDLVFLNGNDITNTGAGIGAYGVTVFGGNGSITGSITISSIGDVNVYNVTLNSTTSEPISIIGNVTAFNTTFNSARDGIQGIGDFNIYNSTFTTERDGIQGIGNVNIYNSTFNAQHDGLWISNGDGTIINSTITGGLYGIYSNTGNITLNNSTVEGETSVGIYTSGWVEATGGSIDGATYGIQANSNDIFLDSTEVTGGTSATFQAAGNNTLTLTNSLRTPIINGVMDGGDGTDTLIAQQVQSTDNGSYIETTFTCAQVTELCTGGNLSFDYKGNTYSIVNFETVTVLTWKPF